MSDLRSRVEKWSEKFFYLIQTDPTGEEVYSLVDENVVFCPFSAQPQAGIAEVKRFVGSYWLSGDGKESLSVFDGKLNRVEQFGDVVVAVFDIVDRARDTFHTFLDNWWVSLTLRKDKDTDFKVISESWSTSLPVDDRIEIMDKLATITGMFEAADILEKVADFADWYTQDGVYLPDNAKICVGREAIRDYLNSPDYQGLVKNIDFANFYLSLQSMQKMGDSYLTIFDNYFRASKTAEWQCTAKQMLIWKRHNGKMMCTYGCNNTNIPFAEAMAMMQK